MCMRRSGRAVVGGGEQAGAACGVGAGASGQGLASRRLGASHAVFCLHSRSAADIQIY
jgi:hypothetical protein